MVFNCSSTDTPSSCEMGVCNQTTHLCECFAGWQDRCDFIECGCITSRLGIQILWAINGAICVYVFSTSVPLLQDFYYKQKKKKKTLRVMMKTNPAFTAGLYFLFLGFPAMFASIGYYITSSYGRVGFEIAPSVFFVIGKFALYGAQLIYSGPLLDQLGKTQPAFRNIVKANRIFQMSGCFFSSFIGLISIGNLILLSEGASTLVNQKIFMLTYFYGMAIALFIQSVFAFLIRWRIASILSDLIAQQSKTTSTKVKASGGGGGGGTSSNDDDSKTLSTKKKTNALENIAEAMHAFWTTVLKQGIFQGLVFLLFAVVEFLHAKHRYLLPLSWMAMPLLFRRMISTLEEMSEDATGSKNSTRPGDQLEAGGGSVIGQSVYVGKIYKQQGLEGGGKTYVTVKNYKVGHEVFFYYTGLFSKERILYYCQKFKDRRVRGFIWTFSFMINVFCVFVLLGRIPAAYAPVAVLGVLLIATLGGWAISLLMMKRMLKNQFLLLRIFIIIVWGICLMDIVYFDERVVIVVLFMCCVFSVFCFDMLIMEAKSFLIKAVTILCGSVPIIVFVLLQGDFVYNRRNTIVTFNFDTNDFPPYNLSVYQTGRDLTVILLVLCLRDAYFIWSHRSSLWFLHLTAAINVRIVPLVKKKENKRETLPSRISRRIIDKEKEKLKQNPLLQPDVKENMVNEEYITERMTQETSNWYEIYDSARDLSTMVNALTKERMTYEEFTQHMEKRFEEIKQDTDDFSEWSDKRQKQNAGPLDLGATSVFSDFGGVNDDLTIVGGRLIRASNLNASAFSPPSLIRKTFDNIRGSTTSKGSKPRASDDAKTTAGGVRDSNDFNTTNTPITEEPQQAQLTTAVGGTIEDGGAHNELAYVDEIILKESDSVAVRLLGRERGIAYLFWAGHPVVRSVAFICFGPPLFIWTFFCLPGFIAYEYSYLLFFMVLPIVRNYTLLNVSILSLLVRKVDFVLDFVGVLIVLGFFGYLLGNSPRLLGIPMIFLVWLGIRCGDARCVFYHTATRLSLYSEIKHFDGYIDFSFRVSAIALTASVIALPIILTLGVVKDVNFNSGIQFNADNEITSFTFFQLISDFILVFSFSFAIEIIYELFRRKGSIVTLRFLQAPVTPQYVDFVNAQEMKQNDKKIEKYETHQIMDENEIMARIVSVRTPMNRVDNRISIRMSPRDHAQQQPYPGGGARNGKRGFFSGSSMHERVESKVEEVKF